MEGLAKWGLAHESVAYDGIGHLDTIGLPSYETADGALTVRPEEIADEIPNFPQKCWEQFKGELEKIRTGGMVA